MNIYANGKVIDLGEGEHYADITNLMCVCGHPLSHHAHTWGYGTLKQWITSQCISCGFAKDNQKFVCEQFRVSNE